MFQNLAKSHKGIGVIAEFVPLWRCTKKDLKQDPPCHNFHQVLLIALLFVILGESLAGPLKF